MKKISISVATILLLASTMTLNSCIGSFTLTKKVLGWNHQVGSKFLNEVVFFAFWILPVYEVTSLADLLVLNSIEFWSGTNPMSALTKVVDTDHGRYMIDCDGKGYTVTCQATGQSMRLDFIEDSQTWELDYKGEKYPLMTFIDDTHVSVPYPGGEMKVIELNESGVMAYQEAAGFSTLAMR